MKTIELKPCPFCGSGEKGGGEMKALKELGVSPAPWNAVRSTVSLRVDSADGICVADDIDMIDDETGEANARLIAAAPELYEALREIVADNKCGLMCSLCGAADKCKIRRAVAALEKAGGAE